MFSIFNNLNFRKLNLFTTRNFIHPMDSNKKLVK